MFSPIAAGMTIDNATIMLGTANNMGVGGPVSVWQKFTVPYTSLQTAGLTNAVTIYTLPIKGIVQAALFNVTQLFSGTAIATITLSCGPIGSLTKYVAAASIAGAGLNAGVALTTPTPESMSATTAIQVNAISTVANLSALTQGSVDVYLLVATVT